MHWRMRTIGAYCTRISKSANVMVTESDHIKVVDFGIARRLDAASVAALTRGGAAPSHKLAGTPAYMAPELLRGEPADRRSDIWALGVLLHEMTARELPFAGQTEYSSPGRFSMSRRVHCPTPYRVRCGRSSNAASQRIRPNALAAQQTCGRRSPT